MSAPSAAAQSGPATFAPAHGDVIVQGAPGTRSATGIEYDHGLLWVSGARFGNALVYDAKTGVLVQELQLATGTAATFINDAVATQRGVYFTDSQRPVLYKVERTGHHVGQVTTIPLGGDYHHVAGAVQSERHRRDAERQDADRRADASPRSSSRSTPRRASRRRSTSAATTSRTATGCSCKGLTLYVVQNRDNKVAVFELSHDLTKATFLRTITDPDLDVPTTIDQSGHRLYVVNARFGTTTPTDQAYQIVRLS